MSKDHLRVVSSDDVKPRSRKSPAQIILESVGPDYKSYRQMANRYGVNVETVRRITRMLDDDGNKKLRCPSKAVEQGKLVMYLFDVKDVAEMDEYMSSRGHVIKDTDE